MGLSRPPAAGTPASYRRERPSSQLSATSRPLHNCFQVNAVRFAPRRSKCSQPLCGAFEESVGSNEISAGPVRHRNTDLGQPLPQVTFLDRSRFPPRLQHLVCRKRTACSDELSSCLKGLSRRQGLFRHRLDSLGPIRQRSAQSVARPCLARAAFGVPVTITSRHMTSLPTAVSIKNGRRMEPMTSIRGGTHLRAGLGDFGRAGGGVGPPLPC